MFDADRREPDRRRAAIAEGRIGQMRATALAKERLLA
jgi:hypothetical protein